MTQLLETVQREIPVRWEDRVGTSDTLLGWLTQVLTASQMSEVDSVIIDHDEYGDAVLGVTGEKETLVCLSRGEDMVHSLAVSHQPERGAECLMDRVVKTRVHWNRS